MPMQNESQIVLYQPDDSIRLEVKIDAGNETVWLNCNQIAELFGRDVKTIGKHINNALREELASETETNVSDVNKQNNPTVAKFATVQIEGGREVTRQVEYYNLDVILSVGYRVKSNRGIQFRRWSNTILKQYLLQGYSINRHLVALQERTDQRFANIEQRLDNQQKQIDFFIRTNVPPIEGIFYEGQVLDARLFTLNPLGCPEALDAIDDLRDASLAMMRDIQRSDVKQSKQLMNELFGVWMFS